MTTPGNGVPLAAEMLLRSGGHAVYRCYSDEGELLYVGTTGSLGRRLASHAEKVWFLRVRGITLEWYADELSALNAERRAIHVEHPALNIVHKNVTTLTPRRQPVAKKKAAAVRRQPTGRADADARDAQTVRGMLATGEQVTIADVQTRVRCRFNRAKRLLDAARKPVEESVPGHQSKRQVNDARDLRTVTTMLADGDVTVAAVQKRLGARFGRAKRLLETARAEGTMQEFVPEPVGAVISNGHGS